ncbi:J domain-containing protein [Iningainema tapete]|uniref:DnaJ domain-containing protein n=1 Tax=Iningainema tapete BLCC-T55 TaxID=2748662 RepID=A0A8J7C8K1_9CYAN|nr:DnaJ domain-containing protein [Iningainema tapete]MBD2776894.1 DnaJ domain-containing protein [Iningainema tapete BLCC-T55]
MSLKIERGLFKYELVDYHAILATPVDADAKEIRKRYLKIARHLHPDSVTIASVAEKQHKSQLLSKLVNPAYEQLSQEKNRTEYILVLSQMGKRLVQESTSVELKSDLARQLASTPNFEHTYKTAIAKIAETQYDSLQQVPQIIALLSELNLVYLMRTAGKSFAASSTVAQPKSNPTPNAPPPKTPTPPAKEDSVVEQYIRRAQELIAKNQLAPAKVELQDALKLAPNNSRCHTLIGVVYLKQNLTTTAKVHFDRALQLDPQDETALAGKRKIEQITGQKPSSSAKQTATPHSGTKQPDSGGSGLFGGLFGGKKK